MIRSRTRCALLAGMALGVLAPATASAQWLCNPGGSKEQGANYWSGGTDGKHYVTKNGNRLNYGFYSWFERSSKDDLGTCKVRLERETDRPRHFRAVWSQNQTWSEDAVGGMGWDAGRTWRRIGYNIGSFEGSVNLRSVATLYGWTCGSRDRQRYPNTAAQEYYVVDTWKGGGQFVPWDENLGSEARPIRRNGSIVQYGANGGLYRIYVVDRNGAQYCGNGQSRAFKQYWAVRQHNRWSGGKQFKKAPLGTNNRITFSVHADQWARHGFSEDKVGNGYQIFAAEVFGSANATNSGHLDASVWED